MITTRTQQLVVVGGSTIGYLTAESLFPESKTAKIAGAIIGAVGGTIGALLLSNEPTKKTHPLKTKLTELKTQCEKIQNILQKRYDFTPKIALLRENMELEMTLLENQIKREENPRTTNLEKDRLLNNPDFKKTGENLNRMLLLLDQGEEES